MTFEELKEHAIMVCRNFPHRAERILEIMENCKDIIESFHSGTDQDQADVRLELQVAYTDINNVIDEEESDESYEEPFDDESA